jgi:ferrous iron transport protein A
MPETLPLQLLPAGQGGEIHQLIGPAERVHRLHEIGLRVGQRIEMLQAGSPCIIKLDGTRLAFREHERIRRCWESLARTR